MPTFVEVAVNVSHVSRTFHYHLPDDLAGQVGAGHLVTVPFGRQIVQGVVFKVVADPEVAETKAISELLDPEPVLTPAQIELAHYLAAETISPLAACLSLMLPPGLSQMADTLYQPGITKEQVAAGTSQGTLKVTQAQWRLLTLLIDRGPLRGRQIDRALPRKNWKASVEALKRRGLITTQPVLNAPTVKPKMVRTAQLAVSAAEVQEKMDTLARKGTPALARRQAIMQFLLRDPGPVDVTWVYAESGGNLSDLKRLSKLSLIFLGESEQVRDPLGKMEFVATTPLDLTTEQAVVWEQVQAGFARAAAGEKIEPFLLYGVTGSGKTEIYLYALQEAIDRGQQAVILVPEIALTPQTVRRFVSRFPGKVGLVHSKLSPGERYDTWRRARAGLISVVVGPRSALFTPFSNLGLIILDESHDQSYYQSELAPTYHARETAAAYAQQIGAVCIFGSATPDIVSTFRAVRGQFRALSLPERILAHKEAVRLQLEGLGVQGDQGSGGRGFQPLEKEAETTELPPVHIVDMRGELKSGNRSIFSRPLQTALKHVLDHHQQAILFINRRGMATYVFCRDCGHSLKCPRCDIPLTFHTTSLKRPGAPALICHRCHYQRQMPKKCPECDSPRIKQYGTGTERVEHEVQALFPKARTIRWDWETTRQKGSHDVILDHFSNHQADILIGTQMLAKGLDLPLVTLVGVVLGDVGLNLPDYRAAERTFQVLTQVAGRAGRSPLGGQAILQTFQPDHYVIQTAGKHDYREFYRQEIQHRRHLGYPPFSRLIRLEFRGDDESKVEASAQGVARQIQGLIQSSSHTGTEMIGPVPCFFARVSGIYRWQIVLRGPDPAAIIRDQNLGNLRLEVDPPTLL
jgi:primosomal protein N' (replication factor Y) (superfamily II helicase)